MIYLCFYVRRFRLFTLSKQSLDAQFLNISLFKLSSNPGYLFLLKLFLVRFVSEYVGIHL